jgi:hypothetical protein
MVVISLWNSMVVISLWNSMVVTIFWNYMRVVRMIRITRVRYQGH